MLMLAPPFPFLPGEYRVKLADATWERASCARLRRAVFCGEQGLFGDDDADAIDAHALPIAALACSIGIPDTVVGTVRIHQDAPGVWMGSRLAVHPDYRGVASVGTELIQHAVRTAHARGARRFLAHVQAQNAGLFRRLHWHPIESLELHGRPHVLMHADLAHYPPRIAEEIGFVVRLKEAA